MTTIPNPYNPLRPPADPSVFFGRAAVFAFFRQHFVGTPLDRPLIVLGRRGLGKSAVLHLLGAQIEERYRVCVVELSALSPLDELTLLAALVNGITRTLEQIGASTYRLPDWPPDAPDLPVEELRTWFADEFLDVVLAALRARHLVLAFDDAHLLWDAAEQGTLPADWGDTLGEWLARYARLDAVLALDAAWEDRLMQHSLLNDPTTHLRLQELPPQEAARLIREPIAEAYTFEDGVVEQILALAGGHPFLLQAFGFLLFRRSEERGHAEPISTEDVQAILPAVLDQADAIFAPLWGAATHNERVTLSALVRLSEALENAPIPFATLHEWLRKAGYALNRTQLAAALRSLGYMGLVQAEEDTYRLPARLIADWVQANVTPPRPQHNARTAARRRALWGALAVLSIVTLVGAFALRKAAGRDATRANIHDVPTATLALDLEGTRQADFATQTEAARPTATPTLTRTRRPSITPSATPSATRTATPSATPSATRTRRPTRTPRPSHTPTLDSGA